MKKLTLIFGALFALLFFAAPVFADTAAPAPADALTLWIGSVGTLISGFGGMPWMMKVSGIIMLIVGTTKIDFFENMFWSHLGKAQTLVGPVLGLIAGIFSMPSFSWAGLAAYAFAGLGANYLYELLDLAKVPAAANATVMMVINLIQSFIKRPSA